MIAPFRKLRTALSFRLGDWLLMLEASAALVMAWALVNLVAPQRWPHSIRPQSRSNQQQSEPDEAQRQNVRQVSRVIQRVTRNFPVELVCLPQAAAARWMLNRRGIVTDIYFGTKRASEEEREFHAWLKAGDLWVTGHCDESEYVVFEPKAVP